MNITKHTPGPWKSGEDGDVFCEGACIAKVCGAPEGIDEAEANARLIAKAPGMEEALTDLLEWAERMGGFEAPCWKRARKAIGRR